MKALIKQKGYDRIHNSIITFLGYQNSIINLSCHKTTFTLKHSIENQSGINGLPAMPDGEGVPAAASEKTDSDAVPHTKQWQQN